MNLDLGFLNQSNKKCLIRILYNGKGVNNFNFSLVFDQL